MNDASNNHVWQLCIRKTAAYVCCSFSYADFRFFRCDIFGVINNERVYLHQEYYTWLRRTFVLNESYFQLYDVRHLERFS